MKDLIWESVLFCTNMDEDVFFQWLDRIKIVERVRGQHRSIIAELGEGPIDDDDLNELIAIFWRYRLDFPQLAQFVHDGNRAWFANPKMFWHKKIFR